MELDQEKIKVLRERGRIISDIRKFLKKRDFVEVSTPTLVKVASGSENAQPIEVNIDADNKYLRTCPEVELKRLVGMGLNKVFEIGKSFRREKEDKTHLTEFTLMELYYVDVSLEYLIDVIVLPLLRIDNKETRRLTYYEAINLFGKDFEKNLTEPTLIYDFPIEYSAYAKKKIVNKNGWIYKVSERAEVYIDGIEVANIYTVVNDFEEQDKRLKSGVYPVPYDEELINILKKDFPHTVGASIGIDRLIMLLLKKKSISDV